MEYKKRIKNEDQDNGNNYTMTEFKVYNLNKDFQSYMRRSLSFGDFKKISDKKIITIMMKIKMKMKIMMKMIFQLIHQI